MAAFRALIATLLGTALQRAAALDISNVQVAVASTDLFNVSTSELGICRPAAALTSATVDFTIRATFDADVTETGAPTYSNLKEEGACNTANGAAAFTQSKCSGTCTGSTKMWSRLAKMLVATKYSNNQLNVTAGGTTYTNAVVSSGQIDVSVTGVSLPVPTTEGVTWPEATITLSQAVSQQYETVKEWCVGSTDCNTNNKFTNKKCGTPVAVSNETVAAPSVTVTANNGDPTKAGNQATTKNWFRFNRDTQPPTFTLSRKGGQQYTLKADVTVDVIAEGGSGDFTFDLFMVNPTTGESIANGSSTGTFPSGSKPFRSSVGITVPCTAAPGPGYTITGTANVGNDLCGASWGAVTAAVEDPFAVTVSNINIQPKTVAASINPAETLQLMKARCFSATRNTNLQRTNTNPGAWHLLQTVGFGGNLAGCDTQVTFSGAKSSVLTIPSSFSFERTGPSYVHLWTNETKASVTDYQNPASTLGPELTNGLLYTETLVNPYTIRVDWTNIGNSGTFNANQKLFMRAKFRWNAAEVPPATDTLFSGVSTASVAQINGVDLLQEATDNSDFSFNLTGCDPFAA